MVLDCAAQGIFRGFKKALLLSPFLKPGSRIVSLLDVELDDAAAGSMCAYWIL